MCLTLKKHKMYKSLKYDLTIFLRHLLLNKAAFIFTNNVKTVILWNIITI